MGEQGEVTVLSTPKKAREADAHPAAPPSPPKIASHTSHHTTTRSTPTCWSSRRWEGASSAPPTPDDQPSALGSGRHGGGRCAAGSLMGPRQPNLA